MPKHLKSYATTPRARKVMDKLPHHHEERRVSRRDSYELDESWPEIIFHLVSAWAAWSLTAGTVTLLVSTAFNWGMLPVWIVVGLPPAALAVILLIIGGVDVRKWALKKSYQRLRKQGHIIDIDVAFVERWGSLCYKANLDLDKHSLDQFPELLEDIKHAQSLLAKAGKLFASDRKAANERIDDIERGIERRMQEVLEPIAEGHKMAQKHQREIDRMTRESEQDILDNEISFFNQ